MNVLMVGTALDTNGQKMRYVDAAKRWGNDPDVLKALWAGSYDLAGVAGRFAEASQDGGPLVIRSAHRAQYAFFQYPVDIAWSRGTEPEVSELAEEADVIHLTNDVKAYFQLRLARLRKPAVIHHHGTLFRSQPARLLAEAKRLRMVSAVSTIDLMRFAPDVLRWVPTAYDLDRLDHIRQEHRRPDDGTVRIISAPTNRQIKSTAALEAAVRTLKAEGLPVELVLVEGRTWQECLEQKATADIYFDQVGLGYGCNAVEAWGMGIPVVAGADEWTLARMRQEWNIGSRKRLPFMEATETTIADALRKLVESANLRATYGALGHAHAAKYHAQKPALTRLAEVYAEAIALRATAPEVDMDEYNRGSGRFTSAKRNLVVRLASRTVQFIDGKAEVTDPDLAFRLRRLVAFDHRRYPVTEVFDG
jgi:hypothetical protein